MSSFSLCVTPLFSAHRVTKCAGFQRDLELRWHWEDKGHGTGEDFCVTLCCEF